MQPSAFDLTQAFVTELERLLDTLQRHFPDDVGVENARAKLSLATFASPKAVLLHFMEYAAPFHPQILARNEEFFLKKGADIPELAGAELSKKWGHLKIDEKAEIWERVQTMQALGDAVIRMS